MAMFEQANYYRAQIRPSNGFSELKTVTWGNVYIIVGKISDGSMRVQSFLFPKDKFSLAEATIQAHMLTRIFEK